MAIYHTIYKQHHGSIPLDSDGRTMEIHHVDGDHSNNVIENLKLVTIQEHYDIHKQQEDWYACFLMSLRMNISTEERSDLAKSGAKKQIENGTHPFLNGENCRKWQNKRIADGTHNWLNNHPSTKRIADGTHNFLDSEFQRNCQLKRIKDGTHNFLNRTKSPCPICGMMLYSNHMAPHLRRKIKCNQLNSL